MSIRTWQLCMLALLAQALLLLKSSSHSTNGSTDLAVLLSFKSHITNDPTQALSTWDAGGDGTSTAVPDFCRWNGVACSDRRRPGRVTAIVLHGLGLVGAISPQLGNLTRLRFIDLSNNSLIGVIPSSVSGCSKLHALNLSMNHLSGTIPASLARLSSLTVFKIGHNNISDEIPVALSNLSALTVFSVERNYLHGRIPSWLGNLTSLIVLDLSQNSFHGSIPGALGKVSKVKNLNLQSNELEGPVPPGLFNFSFIELLGLGFNQLSGSLPQDDGFNLPKLKVFATMDNRFEGPIPASLSNASALEYFMIRTNRHHGQIPPDIGIHGRLRSFSLGYNEFVAREPRDWEFLTSLTNCSNLMILDLVQNNLVGTMPISLANLTKDIEHIELSRNQIVGTIPAELGMFRKLVVLNLAHNLFAGALSEDIGRLSNLHYIDLSHNQFHGQIPQSLGNITQLETLILSNNTLEGNIPTRFGNLTNLKTIDLSWNNLRGQIPQEIFSIYSLSMLLNFCNNALSGSISSQIGHLTNLGTIDLSVNKLSGEIPSAIGSCVALQFLYIQGNLLQGEIPEGLKTLRGLQDLDLSNNNLSGPIPTFIASFNFLTHLNLSFNKLFGPVPITGFFSNATIMSLTGNTMLCGGPPSLQLHSCPSIGYHKTSHHLLHIIIYCIVGIFVFFICSLTAYCINKKRNKQNVTDQRSLFLGEMHERISYADLHAATDSFASGNLIGSGSFGNVYIGTLILDENLLPVAIKVLNLGQRGASRSFLAECDALRRIRHRKLVKVITVCSGLDHNGDEFKALVLEYICNGNLDEWLHPETEMNNMTYRRLTLMKRFYIALDIAEALQYLHHHIEPPIVHCDIKPSNILLDDDMVAHVTDFGLAKIMYAEEFKQKHGGTESSSLVLKGTIGYVAPEYASGSEVSMEGDIYSYGVLLLEMFTGRRPTDNFINGVTSLVNYVKMAYPNRLHDVLDVSATYSGNTQDIMELFVHPIFRLALACCNDSPRQRKKMEYVIEELNAIKKACFVHMPAHEFRGTT